MTIQAGIMVLVLGALMLIVAAFVLSSGSSLLQTQQTAQGLGSTAACGLNSTGGTGGTLLYSGCGYAYNATTYGLSGLNTVSQQQASIGSIVVLATIVVILFGVIGYFALKK